MISGRILHPLKCDLLPPVALRRLQNRQMPTVRTPTVAQITNNGGKIQEKFSRISIQDVLGASETSANPVVRSAYLHIPFCFHKCHYCDFYSIVDSRDRQAEFCDRLIAEIEAAAPFLTTPLQTLFIGGGTPTLLALPFWARLLSTIRDRLSLELEGEFTVEANPETVTDELAAMLASGGVNRVSIGCQSFNPAHLKTLERWHDPANVHRSVKILRRAGIANINLDLIFAIPGQSMAEWVEDLDQALLIAPEHLSCYGLVYEPNTPLTVKMKSGAVTPCDQDLEAQMYHATMQRLTAAGYEHYEISNWSKATVYSSTPRSWRCRHNMMYWTNQNWWAFGPSASGHVNGVRWKNVPRLGEYLEHGPLPPVVDIEHVDEDACVGEQFMLGLRLIEGMELQHVQALLTRGARSDQRRKVIERKINDGLLEQTESRLKFRPKGIMLADSVLAELV